MLVVCTGHATRLVQYLTADDKTYTGSLCFGSETTTDDSEGTIRASAELTFPLDLVTIENAVAALRGHIEQVPPAFSAIHIEGERAYDLARRGESPELQARTVTVHRFDLEVDRNSSTASFIAEVSKGTYIRSLVRDLGRGSGLLAHMTSLRRTRSGAFSLQQALPDEWWEMSAAELVPLGLDGFGQLHQFPIADLDDGTLTLLRHGKHVAESGLSRPGIYRARLTPTGEWVGLVRADDAGTMRVERLLPFSANGAASD